MHISTSTGPTRSRGRPRPAALAHDRARPCTTPGGKALIFVTHNARTRMFIGSIPPGVVLMIEEPTMFFTSIDANTARAYAELVNRQIAEKTTDEEH